MKHLLSCLPAAAALLAITGLTAAQDADPPSRVARIAFITGPVSFEPASVDQWADAAVNYPMTTGDNLYTDNRARAVLRIGQNSIRLNSSTNFQFVNLSDNVVQASINSGGLSVRIRHLFESESWEVDTPNGAITFLRPGEYRVDTDTSGNATMVAVRSGDIEVTANNQSFPVHSGHTAYFDNSGNAPEVQEANQPDDFDSFVSSRDRLEDVPPPQFVSTEMVGYEDLNANGDWRNTVDGPVWTPRVAAGWTPYHDGYWAWIEPWGWTWIDEEPWGFAPFHYGRWAYADDRWGWYPGVIAARPYYAPALVAFVGGGGFRAGFSVGGGGDLVGWFPLGPREAYYPSYHVSPVYIRQVNVTNTRITNINVTNINVTNINYVNRNAIVAVPQNSFTSAQPVRRAAVRVDANQMRQAQVIGMAPRVAPVEASVLVNSSGRRAAAPSAIIASRPVVARLAPPPRAVPFAAKQQMLRQHPGTPVAPQQLEALRAQGGRQNPTPVRMQVQSIDTRQVRPVTPATRSGAAPTFVQRQAEPSNPPRQPLPERQQTQPVPATRPESLPPGREPVQQREARPPAIEQRVEPPVRQQAAPPRQPRPPTEQVRPPERQAPPPAIEQRIEPPVRQQAAPPRQMPPPTEQVLPPERQARPPAIEQRVEPPVRQQAAPPRQTPPPTEQVRPPEREARPPAIEQRIEPPARQQAPPPRQTPPPSEQVRPPERQAPPPVNERRVEPPARQQPQPQAPPKKEEKKPEAKKPEDKKQ